MAIFGRKNIAQAQVYEGGQSETDGGASDDCANLMLINNAGTDVEQKCPIRPSGRKKWDT